MIKEAFKIIRENLLLLLGVGLFTCNLFAFDSSYYGGRAKAYTGYTIGMAKDCPQPLATYYYYNDYTLFLLAIGAILIVIGLLKLRR
ncbi:hypothetical protein KJ693_10900 [bacterium]|nr:hypothetical protein [bacterium]